MSIPDISIVIVSWNVRQLLRDCLDSVRRAQAAGKLAAEIIVVDNASHDGSAELVACDFPTVKLLANPANLGFTKANNQGLRLASGRHLLLLNPDTSVAADSLSGMVSYLDSHAEVGVVGPRLLYADGSPQPSRRRFPTLATAFLESTPLQRVSADNVVLRRYYVDDRSPDDVQEVDWLVGACICVRAAAAREVGLLDERFFMYSEELDWCRRLKSAGWKVVYLPHLTVYHHEAKSSDQNTLGRHQHFHDSRVAYFSKHHGRLSGAVVRLSTVLSFALMLSEESLKFLLVPGKRSERRRSLFVLARALAYHATRLFRA